MVSCRKTNFFSIFLLWVISWFINGRCFHTIFNPLVSQNYEVTRSQNVYNFKTPAMKTAFGKWLFSFAVLHEWKRLPFELKHLSVEKIFREQHFFVLQVYCTALKRYVAVDFPCIKSNSLLLFSLFAQSRRFSFGPSIYLLATCYF